MSAYPPTLVGSIKLQAVVQPQASSSRSTLVRDLVLYSAARLVLVLVIAELLVLAGVPVVVSVLLAIVVALPLSMLLLGSLRNRVTAGLAVVAQRRRSERERLRRQLRGEER